MSEEIEISDSGVSAEIRELSRRNSPPEEEIPNFYTLLIIDKPCFCQAFLYNSNRYYYIFFEK
ncbi:Uncharacterized protein dnm_089720 [Desulfonema magnum]|uniref:Uncharacterized protein n=1 Tax=Desulfonema magnum TaxID=45655 RepID=A0A975GTA9_9BACT|nr:Uncharacterized protein dnm_089720 [Desulfonema magnum]